VPAGTSDWGLSGDDILLKLSDLQLDQQPRDSDILLIIILRYGLQPSGDMDLLIAVTGQLLLLTIPYEISGDEPFAWRLWKWCSGNSIPDFFWNLD